MAKKTVLDAVTLTTDYTNNAGTFICEGELILYIDYTKGAEANMSVEVLVSPDNGANYFTRINSAGVAFNTYASVIAATGKYMLNVSKKLAGNNELFGPLKGERVKVSVKGAAGANGTVTVKTKET